MRERRYVKFKVDIYDDTKTKIIDQRPERDFIHYFFARSIVLAGKADCEGDLYMAKDIPYTIETLATEFNRDAALIKLALDLLIELKMIEVTEDNIYRVKGFVKHQNIKVKEKVEINDKEEINAVVESNTSNKKVEATVDNQIKDSRKNKIQEECKDGKKQVQKENENNEFETKNYKTKNEIDKIENDMDRKKIANDECIEGVKNGIENQAGSTKITIGHENQEIIRDSIRKTDIDGVTTEARKIDTEQDNLVVLEMKDNNKSKVKKKSESGLVTELAVDEIEDDIPILVFSEGDMPPLGEGERLIW